MPKTILAIDDEPDYLKLIDYNLSKEGYLVLPVNNAEDGIDSAKKHSPDLIILDLMLPDMDGYEACKTLKNNPKTSSIPVIMLTAKSEEVDKIVGLEIGADDYITKPFSIKELAARVKVVLRRYDKQSGNIETLTSGALSLNPKQRRFFLKGKEIRLTNTEFYIVKALMEEQGNVLTRDDLLEIARGDETSFLERTIDVHIVSLRKKLGKAGKMIETVRGAGYRLNAGQ